MLQPGTILLEKYRVERVLGKGGMGIVVAVRHIQLGELFAIKILLPESRDQPEALERFLREARASAKLKGEHVARVHDIGKLPDGTPYMLMEYLEGEDLGQFLERRGALPVEEAALYVHQACEAVAKAHAAGIVHRDLKPSNLFLTHQANGLPCVKVLDFGIVKELDPENKVGKRLTKTGTFLGSPIYMPPEQMADIKATDTRGDVWALGVILYEFVTGRAPFESEAVTTVITKVLLTHPDPPSHLNPAVPVEFDAIVMRCLEKQPERRYPTARELMIALEPFVGSPAAISHAILESSGPNSHPAIASRIQVAETIADNGTPQHLVLAQTLADPVLISQAAVAETISGNILDNVVANAQPAPAEAAMSSIPAPNADLTNAEKSREDKREAAETNDSRKTLLWILAAAAAFVLIGTVGLFSTDKTNASVAASGISSVNTSENPPAASESPKPEVVPMNQSESSAAPKGSISSAPVADTTAADVATAALRTSTNAPALPTKPSSATSTSRRVTTKKTRVPGYDD